MIAILDISILPLIVIDLAPPSKNIVCPSSSVCATLAITFPAPLIALFDTTVGLAADGSIPTPLIAIPWLMLPTSAKGIVVLALTALLVVVDADELVPSPA